MTAPLPLYWSSSSSPITSTAMAVGNDEAGPKSPNPPVSTVIAVRAAEMVRRMHMAAR